MQIIPRLRGKFGDVREMQQNYKWRHKIQKDAMMTNGNIWFILIKSNVFICLFSFSIG